MSQTFPEPEPRPDEQPTQVTQQAPGQVPPPGYAPSRSGWATTLASQLDQGQQGAVRWVYEVGNWIFGLLTLTAVILGLILILLGNADHASLVAGLAIAIALPFNLVGLWLAYYLKGAANTASSPAKKQVIDSTALLALSAGTVFTLVSLSSALWRVSWAVTIIFLVISIISLWLILRVQRSA